jgi:hypothetical protein
MTGLAHGPVTSLAPAAGRERVDGQCLALDGPRVSGHEAYLCRSDKFMPSMLPPAVVDPMPAA